MLLLRENLGETIRFLLLGSMKIMDPDATCRTHCLSKDCPILPMNLISHYVNQDK